MVSEKAQVSHDVFPYLRVYKDGTIERFAGTEVVPAGLDPETGVFSKDTVIVPETRVSARLYRPSLAKASQKLPLVIYFHGGGFFISSTADPLYHRSLNKLVAEANIVLVSVDYRLAPENSLPAAYEDSWAALNWVAAHAGEGDGKEAWLKDYADFGRVFLGGDSCGANMTHHLTLKLKGSELSRELKIEGVAMIHPYFWGKDPVGVEKIDHVRRSMVDNWWTFICPSHKGCDDPFINPFADGSPSLEGLACNRVLVIVADKDLLRDRGKLYYEKLLSSGWKGTAKLVEIRGEDHVFHIFDPNTENAKSMFRDLASFFGKARH